MTDPLYDSWSDEALDTGMDPRRSTRDRSFESFLHTVRTLPAGAFLRGDGTRFNVPLYEAVFAAACDNALREGRLPGGTLSADRLRDLDTDEQFTQATRAGTARTGNVKTRLARARAIVGAF